MAYSDDAASLAANTLNNLTQLRSQNIVHDDTEAALAENQRQFDANIALQAHEFTDNMNFLKNQHSEQMDFANRNLNANIDIANQNFDLQKQAYEKNLELQNRQFDYQKELNNTQMEREDTAIQRAVADFKAAGFSPLAAIGTSGSSSSPLSSAAASSVNAAQYEVGGINTAAGQYADFAKQYSALAYEAQQNYSNSRSQLAEKHNTDILASRITLAKMRQDMRLGYGNLATQLFNSVVNAKKSRIQNEYLEEQLNYLEDRHKWEESNGYRGQTAGQVLVNAITEYLDSKKKDEGETRFSTAYNVSKETAHKIGVTVKENLDKLPNDIKEKINNSDLEDYQKIALTAYTEFLFHPIKYLRESSEAVFEAGKDLYNKYIKRGK